MVGDRKIGILKTALRWGTHLGIVLFYAFPLFASPVHQGNAQFRSANWQPMYLQVDTLFDSNEAAYQVCSGEPSDCSLRGAISKANLSPEQEFLIGIPAGVYNLIIPGAEEEQNVTGDLDIYGRVTLAGVAAETTQIDGNALDRILQAHSSARVILQDLTITDGLTPPGVNGGGIYNQGKLTITRGLITRNAAGSGGSGGGIYNAGRLVIQDSQIENNTAGEGADGYGESGEGGPGGNGGAISNIGSLTINQTNISENRAGDGGNGHEESYQVGGDGGPGGNGGAISNIGSLTINQTNISGNRAGDGGSGCCTFGENPPFLYLGGQGGDGGDGGGIHNIGTLRIYGSIVSGNRTGSGGGGGAGGWYGSPGAPGYGGNGGGLYNLSTLAIEDSEVSENFTNDGGRERDGGKGGGIYIERGTANILYSQVNLNITGAGGGSWLDKGGLYPGGTGGAGGGIYIQQGVLILDDVSIVGNKTGEGGAGKGGGSGGGVFNAGILTVNSSVIRTNQTGKGGKEELDDYMGMDLSAQPGGRGGGIFNLGDLLIIYSQIEGNQTGEGGDALRDCAPGGGGGGIFNQGTVQMFSSQAHGNKSGNSGGSDERGGYNCEGGSGGGVYNAGDINIEYSSILSNTTGDGGPDMNSGSGGGLYNDGSLFLNGVSLRKNQAGQNGTGGLGGGAYLAGDSSNNIWNTLIADNHLVPAGLGSGIFVDKASLNLWHTTLARNTGGDGSGLHSLEAISGLTNTIVVSHTIGITASAGSIIGLDSTLWGSGSWANFTDMSGSGSITHTHSLTGTPGFVNPDLGDYHLGAGSEARDQGIHSISATDLDNQPRPNPDTNLPDLGADEYWSPTPITAVSITAPISGTTYANIPFTATVMPNQATPNFFYVWVPSPDTGQGSKIATYIWHNAGQKMVQVTVLNAYGSALATQDITIIAFEFKTYLPIIHHAR